MTTEHRICGNAGESFVTSRLEKEGFTIKARNYTRRGGEIDIIAEKDEVRAFVEVKTRAREYFDLSEVITPTKQQRIVKTACCYNSEHTLGEKQICRFDVALVIGNGEHYNLTYIPNAFIPYNEWLP